MQDYLDSLNPSQREAVLHTEGPLMILAGAGSGKTKTLTSRMVHLVQDLGIPPWQILAVTFTNKAAREMRERVQRGLGSNAIPEIGTFHSICIQWIRREIACTPFEKPFVIYDDSDQLSLVKASMNQLQIDDKSFNPKAIQSAINRLKCDAVEYSEMQPTAHQIFERQVKRVYEQYQKELFKNQALDFGEILCMAYRILRDFPEVRRKYQARYRAIHVDEYQDTNRAQYLLLSMLALPKHGGHRNICVVGDEDQSIYKWRGADINNILDFENDYPGAKVVKLEQNYRSTKTIIQAAGQVIKNNVSRKDKTLWTENEEGVPIIRAQLPDERMEAEFVVSEIKRLAEHESRTFAEFAIFYRTNAQSRPFEDILRREKIPYQVFGGLRFYDRKEVKDVLAYLRVILNPADSISLKRIINVPARGIGKTTLERLDALAQSQGAGVWTLLEQLTDQTLSDPSIGASALKKLSAFVGLLRRLMASQPQWLLSDLYHAILDETGYVRALKEEKTDEASARVENLEELSRVFQEFEEDFMAKEPGAPKSLLLPAFIEQSALASEGDQNGGEITALNLMTLHSSKGLEFPVVFLVGMEDGLFPSIKSWEETPLEDIEEERRLCYVGMTRAREQLYLSHVQVRRFWGDVRYQDPSRFFEEMPEALVEFRDYSQSLRSPGHDSRGVRSPQGLAPARGFSGAQAGGGMIGRKMDHPEYGSGIVVNLEGSGENSKVTVEFGSRRQQRKFLLRYVEGHLRS